MAVLPFVHAHATHPDWRMAFSLAAAQIDACKRQHWHEEDASAATLGFAYFTDHYAPHGQELMQALNSRWPGVSWVGSVGVGIAACGVEYFDEPALALMLSTIPHGRFKVFSGARPLGGIEAWTALVHADPATHDLADLVAEMSDRTGSGYLFGGLSSSRGPAWQLADGALQGGLSGVAFAREVGLISRVTQGSQPLAAAHIITAAEHNMVLELDHQAALDVLVEDLKIDLAHPPSALPRLRSTLVGLSGGTASPLRSQDRQRGLRPQRSDRQSFGPDVRVRHLLGLDTVRRAVAIADHVQVGQELAFCSRNAEAARRDLVRICSEIREEVMEPLTMEEGADPEGAMPLASAPLDPASRIAGALYVSCSGRGGPHFGGASAELQIVQRALGAVPLIGFFAAGEIAHQHLYGYTGVLTVFTREA